MDAIFYKGKENSVLMTLTNNGAAVLPSTVTKVEFKYGVWSANSTDNSDLFAFETTGIRLKFGAASLGKGRYLMNVIIYSADHPLGIVWKTGVDIEIIQL